MTTPATHYLGHTSATARIERFAAAHDYALQRRLDREDAVAARAESEATMSEPLSVAELEELRAQDERQFDALRAALAQHSDANDVSNSDVQLLRLSVESLMGSQREDSHE